MRMPSLRSDLAILLAVALLPTTLHAQSPEAAPPLRHSAAECEVWARELSFARSVVEHDAAAFAEHLHPQAVFGTSQPVPTRGREAIAREWAGLVAGDPVELQWYPTHVVIGGEPDIAYSSGPALFRRKDANGAAQVSLGAFGSVWKRGDDGVWRILFDDGIRPVPASAEQAAAFIAARRDCPRG
jgi:ketosteroid isomerase-like protein